MGNKGETYLTEGSLRTEMNGLFFTEPTPGLPNRGLGLPSYKIAGFYLFYKENRAEIFIITGLTLVMILLMVMLLWMAIKLKEEKIKHKTLIDAVPEVIMQLDREGKCVWINELGTKFFGEGINGCHINNFLVNSSDREKVREAFESLFEGNEKVIISETLVKGKSGQIRLLKWCFVKLKMNNKVCQVIATARDITEKRKKKIQLKTNEKRYRDLFENSPVGLLKCDSKGNIIDINKHMLEILGSPDKKETLKFNLLMLPNLKESGISGHLEKVFKENVIIENERKYTSMWGKEIWLYYKIYPVTDEKGSVIEAVAACIDITERRKAEEKINYLSFHDSLTGLYNRAYFREELKRLDTKRQLPISIIMGDANGLKLVNDAFGHYEGDKLLKKIAHILKESCRQEDIIARWGGDEFIVLLPQTNEDKAIKIATRIKKGLSEAEDKPIKPSMSLGVATKNSDRQKIEEVLKEAEDRMYRNKLIESKNIRNSIIDSLQNRLKEIETKEHCCRLQELVLKIGRALELPDNQLDELALLSLLHDIGKVVIPKNIFMKGDSLSQEDQEIIKKHSETGYRIALASPDLAHIANAILAHHEHWDGSGYPQGLKEKEIPFNARVLAIAHAYEIMTGGYFNKQPISHEEALEELKKYAGSRFDPKLVKKFVEIMSN